MIEVNTRNVEQCFTWNDTCFMLLVLSHQWARVRLKPHYNWVLSTYVQTIMSYILYLHCCCCLASVSRVGNSWICYCGGSFFYVDVVGQIALLCFTQLCMWTVTLRARVFTMWVSELMYSIGSTVLSSRSQAQIMFQFCFLDVHLKKMKSTVMSFI